MTTGPHPMFYRREEMHRLNIKSAADLRATANASAFVHSGSKEAGSRVELGVNCNHFSRVHISDLERGVREVGLYKLRKIAKAFNTTMSRLLSGF
jgi:transcriptional regulator with XRE-family HTH domain